MRTENLAFIDTETTGLDLEHHEIIEIGCVLVRQIEREGKGPQVEIIEEFEYKIKPEHIETADSESLRINGYDPANWVFALDRKKALEDLAKKVDGAIMVAHNAPFDYSFLQKAFDEEGIKNPMHYHRLDTIPIAFACLYDDPTVQKFSLRALCEHFGIENKNAHTALSDARATFELYKKLLNL